MNGLAAPAARRVVLVPGLPAMLPRNASLDDPIPGLRAASCAAVNWLVELGVPIEIRATPSGLHVATSLLAQAGGDCFEKPPNGQSAGQSAGQSGGQSGGAILVIGNGSACRTEKAPGFLDSRAVGFDESLEQALRRPDPVALLAVDELLSAQLMADVDAIRSLGAEVLTGGHRAKVDYADDPYGVQYWVIRWELIE